MFSHFSLSFTSSKIPLSEVFDICRMNRPIMSFSVGRPPCFNEAIIKRQVMSNRISPAGTTRSKIGIVVKNMLIDVRKDEFTFRRAEDRHRNESNVTVLRFWFFGLQRSLLKQRHGKREAWSVRSIARCNRGIQTETFSDGVVVKLESVVVYRGGGDGGRVFSQRPGASVGSAAHVRGDGRCASAAGRADGGRQRRSLGGRSVAGQSPLARSLYTCFCLATPHSDGFATPHALP